MYNYQQEERRVVKSTQVRRTRRGWIGNKIKQTHLRQDIPCGLQPNQSNKGGTFFGAQPNTPLTILLIDTHTLVHQTDIIYNCQQISNLIILQSTITAFKNHNPVGNTSKTQQRGQALSKYNVFRDWVERMEQGDERKVFVMADQYHKGIRSESEPMEREDKDLWELGRIEQTIRWYNRQAKDMGYSQLDFSLLTSNPAILKDKQVTSIKVVSLVDFLQLCNSNLLDFMGFDQQVLLGSKQVFADHMEIQEALQEVRKGRLFEGKYMGTKSYFKIGREMFKMDLQNNRAIFGDVVIIELAPRTQWGLINIKRLAREDQYIGQGTETIVKSGQADDQGNEDLLEYLHQNPTVHPKGHIVSIAKRQSRNYCGTVDTSSCLQTGSMQDQSKTSFKICTFMPADDKYTPFYIRTTNPQQLTNKRIMVSFDKWPVSSRYPLCHFVRTIGNVGDHRAEADTILLQHNVEIREFSKAAYACLPPQGEQFAIPKQQETVREDLRGIDVVSIDPPGCKDIDDALHCFTLPNGNIQIGVHIADVSYYVRPDSALDMEARNRCTTVYLVDRRTDMLPKLLTQNLCSLRSNVDRLAFSVMWEVNPNTAQIISTRFGKTIIRSRKAFTYKQAQDLKDSDDQGNIACSIRSLNKIAKLLKQKRLQDGALTLASTQVKITLEQETHSATDVKLYDMMETNYLIEEFMLLGNIAVAKKIYQRFPALSILRRHSSPKPAELQTLKEVLSNMGYQLHFETSRQLADSLDQITRKDDQFFNKLVRVMTTRCMNEATYFCSADFDSRQFYHYGLAAPFYTHFTSPIRRYADVLVHRLLAAAIDLEPLPTFMINKQKMGRICDQMNMRNRMARYASRASSDYHTYQFFKDKSRAQKAVITCIDVETVTLMLTKYGLQSKLTLSEGESQETKKMNEGKGVFTVCQMQGAKYELFEYLDVQVRVELKGFHKIMHINLLQ